MIYQSFTWTLSPLCLLGNFILFSPGFAQYYYENIDCFTNFHFNKGRVLKKKIKNLISVVWSGEWSSPCFVFQWYHNKLHFLSQHVLCYCENIFFMIQSRNYVMCTLFFWMFSFYYCQYITVRIWKVILAITFSLINFSMNEFLLEIHSYSTVLCCDALWWN